MTTAERREAILQLLDGAEKPLNASYLAGQFGVSRQIIVGDVALLRACGENIVATPRGYLKNRESDRITRTVACIHTEEQMLEELNCIVDQGCIVEDVIVEHPLYGQLIGKLELSNRYEAGQFAQRCCEESAHPLSLLTDGVHLHTVRCPNEDAYLRVCAALRERGFLLED